MIVVAALVVFVFLAFSDARPAALRLAVVGILAAVITAYFWLPFLQYQDYLNASPYLPRWKYDSFGAIDVLTRLFRGDLLDSGRLRVLTLLLAFGLASSAMSPNREGRMALAVFVVWLLLYFGRPTWGSLADLMPMHQGLLFHRFIGGVHLGAILLIGLGGEWLWQRFSGFSNPWRTLLPGLIVAILMLPALKERFELYSAQASSMEENRIALENDRDLRSVLDELKRLPPGRTYAGLRANWGDKMKVGELKVFDLLPFLDIAMLGPPFESLSLNSDLIWHFNDRDPVQYDLFDVEYVIAPASEQMLDISKPFGFLTPIMKTARYTLYRANTKGYGTIAQSLVAKSSDSGATLLSENKNWLTFGAAVGQFIRWSYPAATGPAQDASVPPAAASAPPPGAPLRGTVSERRVGPGLIELQAKLDSESVVVVKTTYHPKWSATIDGRHADTFMVSPSYIGLLVPAGIHRIRVEYRSGALKNVLLAISIATVAGAIVARRKLQMIDKFFRQRSEPSGAA